MSDTLSDLAALQGVWEQVGLEENGVAKPHDALGPPGALTTIHQNHFAVRATDGALLLEGHFELDEASDPKSINWIDAIGPDAGKSLPAIYRLDGDDFVFVAADAGALRPAQFRTTAGEILRRFVRRR